MLVTTEDKSHVVVVDIDSNGCCQRSSAADEGCSDAADRSHEEQRSSHDPGTEIVGVCEKERGSSASECSVEVDLEEGSVPEVKVHLDNVERDCRICHLSMDMTNHESGTPIELGCSCKDDLAAAHKQCAEAWFKIKGNKTCEICGSIAHNVAGAIEIQMTEQWNEGNDSSAAAASGAAAPTETRNFWQGHRFLNFLLACMVFAFVISWLFHFNVPS
ncbi:uncharacterized protein LOC114193485 [Vigna unguiculata]|uniref:RING-CH-type domain-containing protein n=1 Tax=Vigna unguiculata TaxID=3917 RepID=A0A4D6MKU4_VIGUN|nr:uncharacterized protein LOC114193485 [Vigna unguiculata]XP_027939112.1 uncharacterized protein LOC114193485 [Vigna unguiculata]QCE01291.1 hypothetical protein DEO72_LG7g2587 [Vigna unguiculata]